MERCFIFSGFGWEWTARSGHNPFGGARRGTHRGRASVPSVARGGAVSKPHLQLEKQQELESDQNEDAPVRRVSLRDGCEEALPAAHFKALQSEKLEMLQVRLFHRSQGGADAAFADPPQDPQIKVPSLRLSHQQQEASGVPSGHPLEREQL